MQIDRSLRSMQKEGRDLNLFGNAAGRVTNPFASKPFCVTHLRSTLTQSRFHYHQKHLPSTDALPKPAKISRQRGKERIGHERTQQKGGKLELRAGTAEC